MMQEIYKFSFDNFNFKIYAFDDPKTFHLYINDEYIQKFEIDGHHGGFLRCPIKRNIDFLKGLPNEEEIYNKLEKELYIFLYGNPSLLNDLERVYSQKVSRKIYNTLIKEMEKKEYSDNPRFCKVGILEQEKEYKRRQKKGCCGFFDEVIDIDDEKYLIGFNYGH